jgi:L-lactate dehydrogenase complex protein LldG
VLQRIRAALGAGTAAAEVPRDYRLAGADAPEADVDAGEADVVARFCERVAEYRATVTRVTAAELPATLARLCAGRRIGVPRAMPAPAGANAVVDDPPLSVEDLDALDGALTGAALAIADTGTIVLDGGERSGRRALSLVPDWHVCVVAAADIVASVPDAVAALASAAAAGAPITLVSGPSATSDIELERVEGVHGPRTLDVVVVDGG